MKKGKPIAPGNEIRGMRIRLYPTADQIAALDSLRRDARLAWNWMVKNLGDEAREANVAHLIRIGVVPPKPRRPDYNGMAPEESEQAASEHRQRVRNWWVGVDKALKQTGLPTRKIQDWQEHFGDPRDYHLLSRVISWSERERPVELGSKALEAIVHTFFRKGAPGSRPKQAKGRHDHMPLLLRSRICLSIGDYGSRRNSPGWYNCQVAYNGLKIRGRLPAMEPDGRVLQGCSIVEEADGWWASVKYETPKRQNPSPTPGLVVGIDVGLDVIAAFDDGHLIPNTRTREFSEMIADRQWAGEPVGRIHQRAARHLKHLIYADIIPRVADAEVIAIEELPPWIGQRGSVKVSVMRSIASALKGRYGDRVREVPAAFTSQDCSNCGHRDKSTWGYDESLGPIRTCLACRFVCHRDINAARNIRARALDLLVENAA